MSAQPAFISVCAHAAVLLRSFIFLSLLAVSIGVISCPHPNGVEPKSGINSVALRWAEDKVEKSNYSWFYGCGCEGDRSISILKNGRDGTSKFDWRYTIRQTNRLYILHSILL